MTMMSILGCRAEQARNLDGFFDINVAGANTDICTQETTTVCEQEVYRSGHRYRNEQKKGSNRSTPLSDENQDEEE